MFFQELQSTLALVGVVLMQTRNFFHKNSHADPTKMFCSLEVLYYMYVVHTVLLANSMYGSKLHLQNPYTATTL